MAPVAVQRTYEWRKQYGGKVAYTGSVCYITMLHILYLCYKIILSYHIIIFSFSTDCVTLYILYCMVSYYIHSNLFQRTSAAWLGAAKS